MHGSLMVLQCRGMEVCGRAAGKWMVLMDQIKEAPIHLYTAFA